MESLSRGAAAQRMSARWRSLLWVFALVPGMAMAVFRFPTIPPDAVAHAPISDERPGESVAVVGDVNGDGIADFIIGAPGANGGNGAAYLVYGTGSGELPLLQLGSLEYTGAGVRFFGFFPNGRFGAVVAAAGDVNGDGLADVLIGAPGEGVAYLLFGRAQGWPGLVAMNDMIWIGNRMPDPATGAFTAWGYSVAGAGDLNGDGYADMVVGTGAADSQGNMACVIFGKADLQSGGPIDCNALWGGQGLRITLGAGSTAGAFSVASAGDLNRDGFDDLIIGSPDESTAYLVFGMPLFPVGLDVQWGFDIARITGAPGSRFGHAVAGRFDFNGDGLKDLAISAPLASDDLAPEAGKTFVIFGSPAPDAFPAVLDATMVMMPLGRGTEIWGTTPAEHTGASLAAIGDMNHDGMGDLAIGAPDASCNGSGAGVAYVVFGRTGADQPMPYAQLLAPGSDFPFLNGRTGLYLPGNQAGDRFGWAVAGGGDINADGIDDLMVGVPQEQSFYGGAVYFYFGQEPDVAPPVTSIHPSVAPNSFGWNNTGVSLLITASDETGVQEMRAVLDPVAVPPGFDDMPSMNGPIPVSSEGVHTVYAASMDLLGHKEAAPVSAVVRIDLTAPKVKVTGVTRGATYKLGSVPAAGCKTTDALSGVAVNALASVTGGRANGTGTFTVLCAGARDKAGNAGSAQLKYSVVK